MLGYHYTQDLTLKNWYTKQNFSSYSIVIIIFGKQDELYLYPEGSLYRIGMLNLVKNYFLE